MALFIGFDASNIPVTLPTNDAGEILFDGFSISPKRPVSVTPEELRFTTVTPGSTIIWYGSDFRVDAGGAVVAGQVTGVTVKIGTQSFVELTELEGLDAEKLFSLSVGDPEDSIGPTFAYLLQGDDVLIGTNLGDGSLNGYGGDDTIFGRGGDDILTGGIGSDELYGGNGKDILIGVNPLAKNPGAGEQDILTGGQGADIFVLGDSKTAYYIASGNDDYALITDFQIGQDKIQLQGEASNYVLAPYSFGCSYGTGIYLKGVDANCGYGSRELIGVMENICSCTLSLSDPNQFVYAS